MTPSRLRSEAPTLALILVCYGIWGLAVFGLALVWMPLAVAALAVAVALHSSLQHEVLHGHPTPWPRLNAALVFAAVGLFIPYLRFRDTHLAHHRDALLTDPYDDPESNYLDPAVWRGLPRWWQAVLLANNTLLGRMVLGPLIGQISFMREDWRLIRQRSRRVALGWALHLPALALVCAVVAVSAMPFWAYLAGAYLGLSILKIRTFLEHQAHENTAGRTVIIEDRGPLSWLFLNNNLHLVHHMHPMVPWRALPQLYAGNKARYVSRNFGYVYRSYGDVFRAHLLRRKDPVPHPLWHRPPQ